MVARTVAVGLVGLVFEQPLQRLFQDARTYWLVAVLLLVQSGGLAYGEY